jgi:hypothetical protein
METQAPAIGELLPVIVASFFYLPVSRCKRLGKDCQFREVRSVNSGIPRDRDR